MGNSILNIVYMENDSKIRYFDSLIEIRSKIAYCFGEVDGKWGHASDELRAEQIVEIARTNNISLNDIQDIVLGFLFRLPCHLEHINEESEKAMNFFSKKLSL